MMKFDLNEWGICNPDNREDVLPQPYRLISEVLGETILYQLSLKMFEIQQKKKDKNYEGTTREYLSQNTIDVENISCLSAFSKHHNHLVAGDKTGNVYLLDLAKKVVFSKKELALGHRVIYLTQTFITDGDVTITTIAVILNNYNKIFILRYKHSQPKLVLTHSIEVATDQNDPNKLPYSCQFSDYGRLLFVYTYDGTIILYRLPQPPIDLSEINKNQTIPLEEQDFKKKLRYPLNYASLESEISKISERILQVKFEGKKISLSRQQLLSKMSKKVQVAPEPIDPKKDTKKKQQKKIQIEQQQIKQQIQYNNQLKKQQLLIENGSDNTPSYPLPKFRPFLYILNSKTELQKKKQFQKGRFIDIPQRLIFGWTNTKQFKIGQFLSKKTIYYPNYIYIQHFLQKIPQKFIKEKSQYLSQKHQIKNIKIYKNIYQITATSLSLPDQQYLACGLLNGAVSVWTTNSINLLFTTDKHQGSVTALQFFEGWKIVSGSSRGQVQIDNIISQTCQVRRTNTFEPKFESRIASIKISELGLCVIVDSNSNLRIYDLWRNQKIARIQACNNFALLQNRGKRWIPDSAIGSSVALYTNNDFTVALSSNWPSHSQRQLQQSQAKRKQVGNLIENPWRCKGTNVHVIRNFQFILSLFQGLQSTYKKGYERKKVQNLFTNLEFTQLYDRNFQIPDFGVTANANRSQAGFGIGSKTHISTRSREKLKDTKTVSQASRGKYKLTNQVLHPEKFLLERRRIDKGEVITDQQLRSSIRATYKRQAALQSALSGDASRNLL